LQDDLLSRNSNDLVQTVINGRQSQHHARLAYKGLRLYLFLCDLQQLRQNLWLPQSDEELFAVEERNEIFLFGVA
jgi:hypothetical protein